MKYTSLFVVLAIQPSHTNGFIHQSPPTAPTSAAIIPLRSRAATTSSSQDDNNTNANPPKLLRLRVGTSQEKAKAALASLRYCYEICILSFIADLFVVLIDREIYYKLIGKKIFAWEDALAVIDTTIVLIFGRGLGMLSRLYQRLIDNPDERLSDADTIKLFRVMGIVWTCCTLGLGLVAV
ncbi:hypothetical protein ACHAWO_005729 [Cyclotella atomus]|uniref:Uncharacterized protein n=1 Tax=Cyclotella atomus TaxID=382360 RepID=A0ABD3P4R6_9STRA